MKKIVVILSIFLFLYFPDRAMASFGVSPADLTFENLLPNTIVEKEFQLSRTDTSSDQKVVVETAVDGVDDWMEVEPGTSFMIAKGQKTKSIKVIIKVPEKPFKSSYAGFVYVKLGGDGTSAGVEVVSGVGISVDLKMADEIIEDLLIRQIAIPDMYEGDLLEVTTLVENKGNSDNAPEKVKISILDSEQNVVIDKETDISEKVRPGAVKSLSILLENSLSMGSYGADISIIDKGVEIRHEELNFNVLKVIAIPLDNGSYNIYSIENVLIYSGLFGFVISDLLLLILLIKDIKKNKL